MKKTLFPASRRLVTGLLLLFISVCLLLAAQSSSSFADWYSLHIYTGLVHILGGFWGVFPFSVSEIFLYVLVVILFLSLLFLIIKTIRKKAGPSDWLRGGSRFFLSASVLFLVYTLCCGINYGRTSFSETAGIETKSYTVEELASLCAALADHVNQLADQVSRDDQGIALAGSDLPQKARTAMIQLGASFPELAGYYPKPKGLLYSRFLSIQSLTGIYSPFTVEANYNRDMTAYNLPFTACHELSHLRGFMQEEEANFIAFLACTGSDIPEFQYSGYLLGWVYASNQLYSADYGLYQQVSQSLSPAVRKDLEANNEFWKAYEGRIAEVSNQWNDSYLKANGQSEGVDSYDRMVDLMMAWRDQIS